MSIVDSGTFNFNKRNKMIGSILFLVSSLAYLILFATMLYMRYKDMNVAGPSPWHFGYDRARKERVMREELAKKSKERTPVDIKGLDEYLT